MTVYVDELRDYGARRWCHMATDGDLEELHAMAEQIGLKRAWFQNHATTPHYDLTPNKRRAAVQHGAIEVMATELVQKCSAVFREVPR